MVYVNNELLHVSTNDVFIFRDVKTQRLETVNCKINLLKYQKQSKHVIYPKMAKLLVETCVSSLRT